MPFYSSPSVRTVWERANKGRARDGHLGTVMAEAVRDHDPDEDHETRPHDMYGNPLDDDGEPMIREDHADEAPAKRRSHKSADDDVDFSDTDPTGDFGDDSDDDGSDIGDAPSSGFTVDDDEDDSVVANKHAFGQAVTVDGHGHGGVPRAQVYDAQPPQPADAGTLTTPQSGALGSSVSANPGNVTVQSLDYRLGAAPTVTYPNAPLAQTAPHIAPNTPQGGRRD